LTYFQGGKKDVKVRMETRISHNGLVTKEKERRAYESDEHKVNDLCYDE